MKIEDILIDLEDEECILDIVDNYSLSHKIRNVRNNELVKKLVFWLRNSHRALDYVLFTIGKIIDDDDDDNDAILFALLVVLIDSCESVAVSVSLMISESSGCFWSKIIADNFLLYRNLKYD